MMLILQQFQQGNQKKAYIKMKNFILTNPNNLIAVYNFAHMSELLNKTDVAIEYYKKVIKPTEQELLNHKEFLKKNLKKNFF